MITVLRNRAGIPPESVIPVGKLNWTKMSKTFSVELSDLYGHNPYSDGRGQHIFIVENPATGKRVAFRQVEDVKDGEGELLYERWTSTSRVNDELLYLKIYND
jgi:hypothetical protein